MAYAWVGSGIGVTCHFVTKTGAYRFLVSEDASGDEERFVEVDLTHGELEAMVEGLQAWVSSREGLDDILGELAYNAYTAASNGKAPVAWETVSLRTQQLWVAAALAVQAEVLGEGSPHGKAKRHAT